MYNININDSIMYHVQCTMYVLQCTIYVVQCKMYNVIMIQVAICISGCKDVYSS